jgi:cysteine protease ATG4
MSCAGYHKYQLFNVSYILSRYIPSLQATFMFPQSLGILGGKPGVSTYVVGVQDEKALFLDPHDVQLVIA